nr:RING-H2 finger protein ATL70-like [Ipomoea batatas]
MDYNTVVGGGSQDDLREELESVGCLVVLTLTVIVYFCYIFVGVWPGNTSRRKRRLGIDEATLEGFQKLLYSQQNEGDSTISSSSGCCICLAEYKDADILRLLPDCGHLFHVNCVDHWLRLRPTCPLCRNSPLPSPKSDSEMHYAFPFCTDDSVGFW